MNKKSHHRALGLMLLLAIIIIASPLFDNKKTISNLTPIVKAPPFPDSASPDKKSPTEN